jgi:hypothetical protein
VFQLSNQQVTASIAQVLNNSCGYVRKYPTKTGVIHRKAEKRKGMDG